MLELDELFNEKTEVDLTPMIDMVFLLLIFFLLTSVFAKPVVDLKLPTSAQGHYQKEKVPVLAINRKQQIIFQDKQISLEELPQRLQQELKNNAGRSLIISADKALSIEKLLKVMDQVKAAGFQSISLETVKK